MTWFDSWMFGAAQWEAVGRRPWDPQHGPGGRGTRERENPPRTALLGDAVLSTRERKVLVATERKLVAHDRRLARRLGCRRRWGWVLLTLPPRRPRTVGALVALAATLVVLAAGAGLVLPGLVVAAVGAGAGACVRRRRSSTPAKRRFGPGGGSDPRRRA